jgi:recombination protein RecA
MSSFDDMFKAVAKKSKGDANTMVFRPGDINIKSNIPWSIRTGLPELDFNMGKPGWPAGRVAELYGFEHCGKTTLGYHAMAQAQRMGGSAWFLDTEKSWDELRAMDCGVDPDFRVGIGDPDSVDAMFRQIQYILEARAEDNDGKPLVIVVDSVTGAATEGMKAKTIGEIEKIAQDAKAIRGGIRRIQPDIAGLNINLFMINHATANITSNKYAKQSDSSGGHSIKLAATVRVAMKAAGWIKTADKTMRLGQKVSLQVEKLKGSQLDYPEVKDTPLLNTVGFDTTESLLRAGIKSGWVDHKPSTKVYKLYDEEFDRKAWPDMVFARGGIDTVYGEWIDWCIEDGCMTRWGRGLE